MFAQHARVAEELGRGADDRRDLVGADEGVETSGEMGLGGEAAADAQREADFALAAEGAFDGGEADVVNLGIRAPDRAADDADFEFARQIVKFAAGADGRAGFQYQRRGVVQFVGGDAGERAAGDVASHIAAGAFAAEADGFERVDDFGNRFDGKPVELNILTDGNIGDAASVALGETGDGAELMRGQQAIGHGDAHHEVGSGFAFPANAADGADAVTLRVDAPPLEEEAPFGGDGIVAVARKRADFFERFPGVLFALEALGFLGGGFF